MKYIIRLTIIFCALVLCTSNVYSHSCGREINHRKEFRKARAVFIGNVLEIQKSQDKDYPLLVTLEVEKQFKGEKKSKVTVLSEFEIILSFVFHVGERYLVYAYTDRMLVPTVCSASYEIGSDPKYTDSRIKKLGSYWYRLFARLYPA